ncbi:MAG: Ig-like domain-containing protein [Cyanobacteria bacterium]|nr:Ig-like domain-containing protein [Cyanobacteriota bacterium]
MLRLLAVAIVTVAVVVACDTVPLTSPTGSTISVSAEKTVLPLGGQTTVNAVVTESAGTAVHNGTTVVFQTTVGSFNPVEAQTRNGVATTTFLAGSASGTAQISAYSGGARSGSGNSSGSGVTIKIGAAAAAGTISVTATPSSVSQSGGTVTVSALVFDADNNPLPGVNVQFVSSTGSLSQTTAVTDANGIARITLSTTQTTTVTAVAGAAKGEVRVEASAAPTVSIEVSTNPVAGQPVAITVNTTSGNNSAPRQVQTLEVNFGDNTSETRSNVTGSAAFTHTYQRDGGYTITARAVDVAGNTGLASRAIVVSRVVPAAGVSANPNSGTAPFNSTISTTASPGTNGPPIESVRTFINGELVHTSSGAGSFAYRFATAGSYRIETVVRDTGGNESRASTIVVAN